MDGSPIVVSAEPIEWFEASELTESAASSAPEAQGGSKIADSIRRSLHSHSAWLLGSLLLLVILACGGASTGIIPEPSATSPFESPTGSPVPQETVSLSPGSTPSLDVDRPTTSPGSDQTSTLAESTKTTATPESVTVPRQVPMVDRGIHSVLLQDIVFDTFGGSPRFLPLDQASNSDILDLRDAIVLIIQPAYGDPGDLPWLEDEDLVIGYRFGDVASAYPLNILDIHEIVNDVIDGEPVLITYCPLCFSGVVFDRELEGLVLTFGNTSALYQSDLVMYDHQTGSYWFQVGGEAVVGSLTGSHLDLLPSATMAWGSGRTYIRRPAC